jgi:hypothetical protein
VTLRTLACRVGTRANTSGARVRGRLIVIAPGVERFEYFRQLTRTAQGQQPPESLRDVQDLYVPHFLNSPEWKPSVTALPALLEFRQDVTIERHRQRRARERCRASKRE